MIQKIMTETNILKDIYDSKKLALIQNKIR